MKNWFVNTEQFSDKKETTKPSNNGNGATTTTDHKVDIHIPSLSESNNTPANNAPVVTGSGQKDKYLKYFDKVMVDNRIPGPPNYEEFYLALMEMKNQPLDEGSKIKNVYITFKAMGITVAKLIETANGYKKIFASKKAAFDADIAQHKNEQVTARENKIKDLIAQNSKIDAQMTQLAKQKQDNLDAAKKLGDERDSMNNALNGQSADFLAAFNEKTAEIDANIGLINAYLGAPVAAPTA